MKGLKINTRIYVINNYGKFLRKIKHLQNGCFEYNCGYARIDQIETNPDSKSKVKFIVNLK